MTEPDTTAAQKSHETVSHSSPLGKRLTSHLGRRLVGLALAALLLTALHSLGWLMAVIDSLGREHLADTNQAYLNHSADSARESFLLLSGLQGGLHMVQSGSAGLSFIVDIEARLGNLLTPLVEMVDHATEIALAGMVANETLALLLDVTDVIAKPILSVLLLLLALYTFSRLATATSNPISRFSGEAAELLLVIFLTLYLALPLAVYGASQLSKSFTAPLATEANDHFSDIDKHLGHDGKKGELKVKVHGVISQYESFSAKLPQKLHHMGEALQRHIVVFLLDVVLFPLALLWLFYRIAQVIARHLVGPLHAVEVVGTKMHHRSE